MLDATVRGFLSHRVEVKSLMALINKDEVSMRYTYRRCAIAIFSSADARCGGLRMPASMAGSLAMRDQARQATPPRRWRRKRLPRRAYHASDLSRRSRFRQATLRLDASPSSTGYHEDAFEYLASSQSIFTEVGRFIDACEIARELFRESREIRAI